MQGYLAYKKTPPPRTLDIAPPGPYRKPMPRVLGGTQGDRNFQMGEVPLYSHPVQAEQVSTCDSSLITKPIYYKTSMTERVFVVIFLPLQEGCRCPSVSV